MDKSELLAQVAQIEKDCPWMTDEFAAIVDALTPQQHVENSAHFAALVDAAWDAIRATHTDEQRKAAHNKLTPPED